MLEKLSSYLRGLPEESSNFALLRLGTDVPLLAQSRTSLSCTAHVRFWG